MLAAHGALPGAVLATASVLGVPYVDTLHGMHDLFDADWRAEASRAARVSAIISVSELVRQQYLAGNPGFPPARIVTIPNGVDEERRRGVDRATARHRLGLRDEYDSSRCPGTACRRTPTVCWRPSARWPGTVQRSTWW